MDYANVEGLVECGFVRIPPVEETLVGYFSQGKSSSLKAPVLPSRLLQTTLHLNGIAYEAAGHARGFAHCGSAASLPGRYA